MSKKIRWFLMILTALMTAGCVYTSKMPPLAEKRHSNKPILITNATVFTGDANSQVLENVNILVENGRIARMGEFSLPRTDCEEIDGTGKMVIPGLIDHHIHIHSPGAPPGFPAMPDDTLLDRNLSSYLYAGITTVFDMAGPLEDMEALRQRADAEDRVNPRLFYVGKCLNVKGGHPDYMLRSMIPWPADVLTINKVMFPVSDREDIREAIRQNKTHGAYMTKIMIDQLPLGIPSLYEELTAQIVAESTAAGLTVGAHIGSESDIITGMNAGVRFFAHAPYRSSLSDITIQKMRANQAVVIPTLVVFESTADFFQQSLQFTSMDKAVLDPNIRNAYMEFPADKLKVSDPRMESWIHDLVTYRDIKFDNVRRMKAAGITIVAGTDSPNVATVGGSSLHTELRLLVEKCGFSPEEAVMAATGVSGKWMETLTGTKGLGQIQAGGPADVLILNKDFRQDIRQTENIYMVIANGRIVERR
jgi:imidazolonepropionase-like amidohydrolase